VDFKGDSFNGHEWKGRHGAQRCLMGQGRGLWSVLAVLASVVEYVGPASEGQGPGALDHGSFTGLRFIHPRPGRAQEPCGPPAPGHGFWAYALYGWFMGQGCDLWTDARRAASIGSLSRIRAHSCGAVVGAKVLAMGARLA
jgi:hypothetical protein